MVAEAQFVVACRAREIFPNCPRYVHRYEKVAPSVFVPRGELRDARAVWKREDWAVDVLPEGDPALDPNRRWCEVETLTVAAVQAAEFLDRDATVQKVVRLTKEAAGLGAKLIVFPETFIPTYPDWVWRATAWDGPFEALTAKLREQSVECRPPRPRSWRRPPSARRPTSRSA